MKEKSLNLLKILNTRKKYDLLPVDLECSFQPKINKREAKNRNPLHKPVGVYLHGEQTRSSIERSKSSSRTRNWLLDLKFPSSKPSPLRIASPEVNKKSREFYYIRKEKLFSSIFQELDSNDNDGYISVDSIYLDKLDIELIATLKPIFDEMERKSITYDINGFVDKCLRFYKKLDPMGRNVVLKYKHHHCENMNRHNMTFSPELCDKTKEIAEMLNVKDKSLVRRLYKKHKDRKDRLFRERELKDKEEMKECTFHPKTTNGVIEKHGVV